MKLLRLSAALSASVISFLPGFHASANAQEPDYFCFMTTQSGQVLDLSKSLCGSKKSTAAVPVNSDQAFIEDYKRKVMEYPDVRDKLLASAKQSPELSIRNAKSVCSILKAGFSLDEIQRTETGEKAERSSTVNDAIISSLAPKYYCPKLTMGSRTPSP